MAPVKKKRIGEILCEKGFLTTSQLEDALEMQKHRYRDRLIGDILLILGYVTVVQVCEAVLVQETGQNEN